MTVREFLAWGKQTCGERFLDLQMGECSYHHYSPFEIGNETKSIELVHGRIPEGPLDPRPIGQYIKVCHE